MRVDDFFLQKLRVSHACVFRSYPTVYDPNNLIEDNSIEIKPMFFHKPSMTSTYDSPESIATPPLESDLDDDQIRNMLASPLYLQEREASGDRSRVSVSSSSHFRESAGRPADVFSHKRKSSQESHSDREGIPLAHRAVRGENEALSRLSESENAARLALEEQGDHLLAEAKSEVKKQECRACFKMRAWCLHTRGRFESANGERTYTHKEKDKNEGEKRKSPPVLLTKIGPRRGITCF